MMLHTCCCTLLICNVWFLSHLSVFKILLKGFRKFSFQKLSRENDYAPLCSLARWLASNTAVVAQPPYGVVAFLSLFLSRTRSVWNPEAVLHRPSARRAYSHLFGLLPSRSRVYVLEGLDVSTTNSIIFLMMERKPQLSFVKGVQILVDLHPFQL